MPEMSRHRKLGKTRVILVFFSPLFGFRKTIGSLIFRCKAIQFCRIDFEISASIGRNFADFKSLVSVGRAPARPYEKPSKKNVPSVEKRLRES